METSLNKTTTQIKSQESDNPPLSPDNSGSHQNRSGIINNAPGKSDEIFEDQNVPSEGEVENIDNNPNVKDDKTGFKKTEDPVEVNDIEINDVDEDFDSIENDLNDNDLDDNALEDLDNDDDIYEEGDEDDPLM